MLPGSVAMQPELICGEDSRAIGKDDPEPLPNGTLTTGRAILLPCLPSHKERLLCSCCAQSPEPKHNALRATQMRQPPPTTAPEETDKATHSLQNRRESHHALRTSQQTQMPPGSTKIMEVYEAVARNGALDTGECGLKVFQSFSF